MNYPKITSAFLNLTNACNLACRYCFVQQNPKHMTLQTAKDAADWLAENAAGTENPSITFFGGEPLLRFEQVIKPLTEYIRRRYGSRYSLSVTSNCTLMTEEKAAFLNENNVGLLLSMDGDRTTQDANRPLRGGGSSFDELVNKLPLILRYWPTVTFRSTVTAKTAKSLYDNMLFAEKQGFANYFVMPNCFEPWSKDAIQTLREQMALYRDHYISKIQSGDPPIFFSQLEKQFAKIVQRNNCIQMGERRNRRLCGSCGKCGLGANRFAGININGDVTACQEMFSRETEELFTIGNIYTGIDDEKRKKLSDLWDSEPAKGDRCETCPLDRVCDGGCVANNYLKSSDMHKVPDIFCEWNRILFDAAVEIMQTLGAGKNETFKRRWNMYVR